MLLYHIPIFFKIVFQNLFSIKKQLLHYILIREAAFTFCQEHYLLFSQHNFVKYDKNIFAFFLGFI